MPKYPEHIECPLVRKVLKKACLKMHASQVMCIDYDKELHYRVLPKGGRPVLKLIVQKRSE